MEYKRKGELMLKTWTTPDFILMSLKQERSLKQFICSITGKSVSVEALKHDLICFATHRRGYEGKVEMMGWTEEREI